MLVFPDPNDSTEYTDPNGDKWEFNGTGWVRQPESSGGGGGSVPILEWDGTPPGEALFYPQYVGSKADSGAINTTWVVPDEVDKISVVVISAGGGGDNGTNQAAGSGGGFSWANDIPVTPGETLDIKIPACHTRRNWGSRQNPGIAEVVRGANRLVGAQSARYWTDNSIANGYRSLPGYPENPTDPSEGGVTSGGGTGGYGYYENNTGNSRVRGGGGAGGWTGNGGDGGTAFSPNAAGTGGAGAGGESRDGKGTGPFEVGVSGSTSNGGEDGSLPLLNGVPYGAGGQGPTGSSVTSNVGYPGLIRIIWGDGRSFPATNCKQEFSYIINDNGTEVGGWDGTGVFLPELYIENDKMYAVYILDQRRVEALNWAAAFKLNPSTEYEYIVVGAGGWGGTGDQTSGNGGGGGGGAVTTGFITTTDGWANVKVGRSYFHDEKDGANALKHSSLLIGDTLIECHGGGQGHSTNANESNNPAITQGGCGGGSMAVESILTGPVQGFVGGMGNATYSSSGGGGGMSSAGMPAGSGKNGADGGEGILTTFFTGREEYVGCGGGSGNIGGTSGGAGGVGGNGYGGTGGGLLQGFVGLPAVGYGNGGGGAGQNNIGRELNGGAGSHGVVALRIAVEDVSNFTTRELAEAFDPSKYACSIYRQREASE
jgi:hypothetical protein